VEGSGGGVAPPQSPDGRALRGKDERATGAGSEVLEGLLS